MCYFVYNYVYGLRLLECNRTFQESWIYIFITKLRCQNRWFLIFWSLNIRHYFSPQFFLPKSRQSLAYYWSDSRLKRLASHDYLILTVISWSSVIGVKLIFSSAAYSKVFHFCLSKKFAEDFLVSSFSYVVQFTSFD